MSYKINFEKYSNNIVLPIEIVNVDLEKVESDFLKVALVIFQDTNTVQGIEEISDTLNISHKKVRQALEYWSERQIIEYRKKSNELNANANVNKPSEKKATKQAIKLQNNVQLEQKTVNQEVVFVLDAIQNLFNHVISKHYHETITYVVEELKLPTDVVLLAFHYCDDIMEKFNISYFQKLCISWSEMQLFTSEKADKYLLELKKNTPEEEKIKETFKINRLLFPKEKEFLRSWIKDYGHSFDLIVCAGELTLEKTGQYAFAYMNTVLSGWHRDCYTDVSQVQHLLPSNKRSNIDSYKNKSALPNTSYDIAEADNMLNEVPKLV